MIDHKKIQDKWQQKWQESKIFEPSPDPKKEKYFITIPYPYISGSLHIGHARVVTEADVYSRYLRQTGKNVLFPLAFHISGTPVLGISLAIKNGDKKKIALYTKYVQAYVPDPKEVKKVVESFIEPINIVNFFIPKMKQEFATLGLAVDWRRSFTSGDPLHQRLVEWQFKKYENQGYLVQGNHPVLFSLTLQNAVGEDDISDGDTNPVEKQEFTLMKFAFQDGFLIAATLRPETMYGQTNMWVNPEVTYLKAKVNGEIWYISQECATKLEYQQHKVETLNKVPATDLIGKSCIAPFIEKEIPILPASFCSASRGSGIVTAVPGHAPHDYVGLKDIQNNPEKYQQFNLNFEQIKKIKPISILNLKGYSQFPAHDVVQKYKITSPQDHDKLALALKDLYKAEHHTGIMNENSGPFANLKVEQAKLQMRQTLLDQNKAATLYETSRPATSRDGGKTIVAVMKNQWFLDFNAKGWKEKSTKCLDTMQIKPNKFRKTFQDVFEWLDKRPCARKRGLGTSLPQDPKWVIESLSDSTLYMTLYTIKAKLDQLNVNQELLSPEFFDYIYTNQGDPKPIAKHLSITTKQLDEIKQSFDYWYPHDHRHTFQAHLSNHLSFMIFAHTACLPKNKWPKKITFHGMVLSEGQKMSKSKGNVVSLIELRNEYGSDTFRAFLCNSTSVDSDMNWQSDEVIKLKNHIEKLFMLLTKIKKNIAPGEPSNPAFISKVERATKKATASLEQMNLREYSNVVLYELYREYQKLERKQENTPQIHNYLFERWVTLLAPLIPHYAEELHEKNNSDSFISLTPWPKADEKLIDPKAEFASDCVETLLSDVTEIQKLSNIKNPQKVTIIIAPEWRFKFIKRFKKEVQNDRNPSTLIKKLMDKQHAKDIVKLIPLFLKNPAKLPVVVLTQDQEVQALKQAQKFIEKTLGCPLEITLAEGSTHKKANSALPGKFGVVVE